LDEASDKMNKGKKQAGDRKRNKREGRGCESKGVTQMLAM
jgi:hypothetical protein